MFLLYAHTAITQHWHWMDALKFGLYWHCLPGGSIGSSHRLRTQSYRTASPSILHTNASLGHHLCLSPTSQRLTVPMTSSSALIYMLKCFIELRGTFYFLEKEMATHSSILAWRIPWTMEPGGLQSMGSHKESHMIEQLHFHFTSSLGFPGGVVIKNLPANAGRCKRCGFNTYVERSPGGRNGTQLQLGVAWKIPWTEESGRLQLTRPQRVGHDWAHTA